MRILIIAASLLAMAAFTGCGSKAAAETDKNIEMTDSNTTKYNDAKIEVATTAGNFTILLYGDTPKHRDNFLKLVKEGYYNGTLFHRVIKEFMIQAGDPDSRNATPGQRLGAGGPAYKIDAEIVFPKHFHKRGALAAARQGDQVNPMKQSSGSQFYVVTGRKVTEGELAQLQNQLDGKRKQKIFNELALAHRDSIIEMQKRGDYDGMRALQDTLIKQTEEKAASMPGITLTDEMRTAYSTVGGAPHLDGDYTVFGEVISGMDTIDKIEQVETDSSDRPRQDVKIISMKVIFE